MIPLAAGLPRFNGPDAPARGHPVKISAYVLTAADNLNGYSLQLSRH